jgi:hypothetical protein
MLKCGAIEEGACEHAAVFPADSVYSGSCRCGAGPSAARRHPMKTLPGDAVGGTRLMEQLPHPDTKRWVVRRKAVVVAAVRSGRITIEEACRVFQLSEEELLAWQRAFEKHGLAGLHITRTSQYRASGRASDVTERSG